MEPGFHHAAIRFRYGPRLGETLPTDPVAWLDAQTRGPGAGLPPGAVNAAFPDSLAVTPEPGIFRHTA